MSVNDSFTLQAEPLALDGGVAPTTARGLSGTRAQPRGTPVRLSLRSNFAWALAGNVGYAACQWGMIVVLARLGNSFLVGQFSLGLAIATPVLMFANLHLRAMQATDARRLYRFSEYRRLRIATTLAAMAVIWGTPTPEMMRVVQIDPGPMPTFTASAPASTRALAPAAVATLPAMISMLKRRLSS